MTIADPQDHLFLRYLTGDLSEEEQKATAPKVGFVEALRTAPTGRSRNPGDFAGYVSTVQDAVDWGGLLMAARAAQKGEATPSQAMRIQEWAELNQRDRTVGGYAGDILAAMPAFMQEMLTGGGIVSGLGKATAGKAIREAAEAAIEALGKKKLAGGLLKGGMQGAAIAVANEAVVAGAGLTGEARQRIFASMAPSITEDEAGELDVTFNATARDFASVLPASILSRLIEPISERSGNALMRIGRMDRLKSAMGSIMGWSMKKNPGEGVRAFKEVIEAVGWNGVVEEWLEERYGGALRSAAGLVLPEDFDGFVKEVFPGAKQMAAEFLAFGLVGAGMTSAQAGLTEFDRQGQSFERFAQQMPTVAAALEKAEEEGDLEIRGRADPEEQRRVQLRTAEGLPPETELTFDGVTRRAEEWVRELSAEDAEFRVRPGFSEAQAAGKLLGIEVAAVAEPGGQKGAEGAYEDGSKRIELSEDLEPGLGVGSVTAAYEHEEFHVWEDQFPEAAESLVAWVKQNLPKKTLIDVWKQYVTDAEAQGLKLDPKTDPFAEGVASLKGKLAPLIHYALEPEGRAVLEEIATHHEGLWQSILRFLRRVVGLSDNPAKDKVEAWLRANELDPSLASQDMAAATLAFYRAREMAREAFRTQLPAVVEAVQAGEEIDEDTAAILQGLNEEMGVEEPAAEAESGEETPKKEPPYEVGEEVWVLTSTGPKKGTYQGSQTATVGRGDTITLHTFDMGESPAENAAPGARARQSMTSDQLEQGVFKTEAEAKAQLEKDIAEQNARDMERARLEREAEQRAEEEEEPEGLDEEREAAEAAEAAEEAGVDEAEQRAQEEEEPAAEGVRQPVAGEAEAKKPDKGKRAVWLKTARGVPPETVLTFDGVAKTAEEWVRELEPVAKWTKAAIVPTRAGVKTVPIEEEPEEAPTGKPAPAAPAEPVPETSEAKALPEEGEAKPAADVTFEEYQDFVREVMGAEFSALIPSEAEAADARAERLDEIEKAHPDYEERLEEPPEGPTIEEEPTDADSVRDGERAPEGDRPEAVPEGAPTEGPGALGGDELEGVGRDPDGGLQSPPVPEEGAGDQHGGDGDRGDGSQSTPGGASSDVRPGDTPLDFRIAPDDPLGKGGPRAKADVNLAAIRTLKKIEGEQRPATPEEQKELVLYVGWGMVEIRQGIFPKETRDGPVYKDGWAKRGKELRDLLTDVEYEEARKSSQWAHYTSREVVEGIWTGMRAMGFEGGRILEPGMGLGHFVGLMPEDLKSKSTYTGVELDPITARISKVLYPRQNIREEDFVKFRMPKGYYDVAIGNPPFSANPPAGAEKEYKGLATHDYFITKTIDLVRPGGVIALITSRWTMDKATDAARARIAKVADFIGAVRLPQTAFKENAGTEVVTDILFFKKRGAGAQELGERTWIQTVTQRIGDESAVVNRWIAEHPSEVLGKPAMTGTMRFKNEYTVEPKRGVSSSGEVLGKTLKEHLSKLPKVMEPREGAGPQAPAEPEASLASTETKIDGYYLDENGKLRQKQPDGAGKLVLPGQGGRNGPQQEIIKSFIPVRDARIELVNANFEGSDEDVKEAQKKLKKAYDRFVKKHGPLNQFKFNKAGQKRYDTRSALKLDPDAWNVLALESNDVEQGKGEKVEFADILTKRVIDPEVVPQIHSAIDALNVTLARTGKVDMPAIAELWGQGIDETVEALGTSVYLDPVLDLWLTEDEYLSGNVVEKLENAKLLARNDPSLQRNVGALEKVQPEPMPPSEVKLRLGMPFLTDEEVNDFASTIGVQGAKARNLKAVGTWAFTADFQTARARDFETERRTATRLVTEMLQGKSTQVFDTIQIGGGQTRRVFNEEATIQAADRRDAINAELNEWVWRDAERGKAVLKRWNREFNTERRRQFNGEHLTLPGSASKFDLRWWQKRGAWRIIQRGNTYLAHAVGSGKTMAFAAAAMEMKRLGIVKKPMLVVPPSMLKQFSSEFLALYPGAKILVADKDNVTPDRRKHLIARAASENWDAIIITHSSFGKIPVRSDFERGFIDEQIAEYRVLLAEARGDEASIVQIEQAIQRLRRKLMDLGTRKDSGGVFEEMGVDFLFVDEAHKFRNLEFTTRDATLKGVRPKGSGMAWDLYMKSRYLEQLHPGRNLALASGTPVVNSIGEAFTLQRFLQPDVIKATGTHQFDPWQALIALNKTELEEDAAGNYRNVSRLRDFLNPEVLQAQIGDVVDSITSTQLREELTKMGVAIPTLKGGERQIVIGEASPEFLAYKQSLDDRLRAIKARPGRAQKGDDIFLKVWTDARHAPIDMRLADPTLPSDPNNKLNLLIRNVFELWGREKKKKGTQLIFSNLGAPTSEELRGFSPYKWIRAELERMGVPASEVAFIQEADNDLKKERLHAKVRAGEIRVLIGGEGMEVGLNVQERLFALHHLDAPWFPASLEQREGRLLRQGNLFYDEVEIFSYNTDQSFDAAMWGTLKGKQEMLDALWSGEEMEGMSMGGDLEASAAAQMGMAQAAVADNPLVMERATLEPEIRKLSALRKGHTDKQFSLQGDIERLESGIKARESALVDTKTAAGIQPELAGKKFAMTVGGKEFTDRKKAGAAVMKAIAPRQNLETEVVRSEFQGGADTTRYRSEAFGKIQIGEVGPFAIFIHGFGGGGDTVWISVKGPGIAKVNVQIGTVSQDHAGLATKIENAATSFAGEAEVLEVNIKSQKEHLAGAKERVGQPFDREKDYQEKRERLEEVKRLLLAEGADAPAPAPAPPPPAPKPSEVYYVARFGDERSEWGSFEKAQAAIIEAMKAAGATEIEVEEAEEAEVGELALTVEGVDYSVTKQRQKRLPHFSPKRTAVLDFLSDDTYDSWLSRRQEADAVVNAHAGSQEIELRRLVGKRTVEEVLKEAFSKEPSLRQLRKMDAAMLLYIDLRGRGQEQFTKWGDKLTPVQRDLYRASQNLPPQIRLMADRIAQENEEFGEQAVKDKILSATVENYIARLWKKSQKEGEGPPDYAVGLGAKFRMKSRHQKRRSLESVLHGWAEGKELEVPGAIEAQRMAQHALNQVREDKALVRHAMKIGLVSKHKKEGMIEIEHPNFRQWVWSGKTEPTEKGKHPAADTFVTPKGDLLMRVPLYGEKKFATALNRALGKSTLGMEGLTQWNAVFKSWILFTSLFHHFAFMRSYTLGTPGTFQVLKSLRLVKSDDPDSKVPQMAAYRDGLRAIEEMGPDLRLLHHNGLTLGRLQDLEEWRLQQSTEIGKVIDKIPVIGNIKTALFKLRDQQLAFLFHRLGPALKIQAALLELNHLRKVHKDALLAGTMTQERIAQIAAIVANKDFGGQNLERMRRAPNQQHVMRLLLLAPDWTESNLMTVTKLFKGGPGSVFRSEDAAERDAFAFMWARTLTRYAVATAIFGLIMAQFGDDELGYWERLKKSFQDPKRLRWMDVDVTPIYRAMGGESERRKYLNTLGHFKDPIKWILQPGRSAKHKASVVGGTVIEAVTGTDWRGHRFTTFGELIGQDRSKGLYKTSGTRSDGSTYRKGEPKWGRLQWQTTTWDFAGSKGPIGWGTFPSFVSSQATGMLPIQGQQMREWLAGELDGFDALARSIGLQVSTAYPGDE